MGVHWFAGTVRGLAASAVLDVVSAFIGLPVVRRSRGGYGYGLSAGVGGASVYWSPGRGDVFVSLPGEVCESLGVPALVALATELDLDPSSRLDVAWDVHGVTPAEPHAAFLAGDVVTRIHRGINPETGRMRGQDWRSNADGDTVYLGSRSSERFVRIYDRRGPTRFEMEWKGQRAVLLWRRLLACSEDRWSAEAMSELRAFLDFRKLDYGLDGKPVAVRYRYLLPWWEAVTEGAGRSCVTVPRAARTLEDKRAWLRSQVAPVLAMVADGVPDWTSELADLLADGRGRYQRRCDRVALVDVARLSWHNAAD